MKPIKCLYHDELTPSLHVDHENGVAFCFGCGKRVDFTDRKQRDDFFLRLSARLEESEQLYAAIKKRLCDEFNMTDEQVALVIGHAKHDHRFQ